MTQKIKFSIERSLDQVALIGVSTRSLALHFGFNEEDASLLELAMVEAVTNAVEHSESTESDTVGVRIGFDGQSFEAWVSDPGPPFQPSERSSLPETLAESGYGLFILQSVADELSWERRDEMNILHFRRSLNSKDNIRKQ